MYPLKSVGEFQIYGCPPQDRQRFESMIRSANQDNLDYLKAADPGPQAMRISGAFVYAHAPNYIGRPALDWGASQWRELFREFRILGLDTAVFQASVWNDLQECYYPSARFGHYKTWNVVEPMIEAAQHEGITLFLGGHGSTSGHRKDVTPAEMAGEEEACLGCFKELMQYRGGFRGFYFTPETAYTGCCDTEKNARLNRIYRRFFDHIKEVDSSLLILMSPGTKYYPGKESEMTQSWLETLDGVPLDILAPQDSIGTCGNRLRHADAMYRVWQDVALAREIALWSNIEIFERGDDLSQWNHSRTADPERVVAQINLAAPYAGKLICWEAPYYLCDPQNPRAARLIRKAFGNADLARTAGGAR